MTHYPFPYVSPTPAGHFSLYFYAAVLHLIEKTSHLKQSFEAVFEQFPFLIGYSDELAEHGLEGKEINEAFPWWCESLDAWESEVSSHLPLRALRKAAALDFAGLTLLMEIGLVEEDPRFGMLYDALQGATGYRRPTTGLLNSWWSGLNPQFEPRAHIRRLQDLGLLRVVNADAPRMEQMLQIPGMLWELFRGEPCEKPARLASYQPNGQLPNIDGLIVAPSLRQKLEKIPDLLATGDIRTLIVRGPQHNGRRTIVAAVAHAMGRGVVIIEGLHKIDDERWNLVGPIALLLHAIPIIVLELSPGETVDLPRLSCYQGPLGIVLGKNGGLSGPGADCSLTVMVDMPTENERRLHWTVGFGPHAASGLDTICERFRMTSGHIRRSAQLAFSYAALDGRQTIIPDDVQQANRALNRQVLDTLAARVECSGDWSRLAAGNDTLGELRSLESRCRHRERLHEHFGPVQSISLNAGVRALFTGPSGTGKTLAAKLLASNLQLDLYRVDLSAVVNKYIGETEKNLNQIFSRAEELDVILLLDEGDALLTQRTNVQSSNDRYANLETNFLLQRIESFEGILIVTTNTGNRIDGAFQRRMDVVVEFRQPEPAERWALWQLHLLPGHKVDGGLLSTIAGVCALNGGQIRNAVMHASLLALSDGKVITSAHLEEALQREYRKAGAVCPLRRRA
jgi:hypothetical protein